MKKILLFFVIIIISYSAMAQKGKTSSYIAPIMTYEFSDYLKTAIAGIIARDFNIELSYTSTISPEGKLLKPLILKQRSYDDDDNVFVQNMRYIIMNAPAWIPARDTVANNNISNNVLFEVDIKKGQISISSSKKN